MFTQFRIRYPQGSLLSEFVVIDHGKYVVRAIIANEGVSLATGLAAAETVEEAEDRARERAFVALGVQLSSPPSPEFDAPAVRTNNSGVGMENSSLPTTPAQQVTPPTVPVEKQAEVSQVPLAETEPALNLDSEKTDSWFSSPEMLEETEPNSTELTEEKETERETPPPSSPAHSPSFSEGDPVDFSDIIAKTNIEMKRLQWTSEQGREYLLQTYGKRSRQLLKDEELLEFLHYLEVQPTPR